MDTNGLKVEKDEIQKAIETKLGTDKFIILDEIFTRNSERLGLLGDYGFLKLNIKCDTEPYERTFQFFVKFFPLIPLSAQFATKTGAYAKEIFIYNLFERFKREGIDIVDKCAPGCYLKLPNKMLIMDDLMSEGYKTLDKHTTLSLDHMKTITETLAKLHASSLIYEEKLSRKDKKIYRLIDEYASELEEGFYNDREDYINRSGVDASIKGVLGQIKIFNFPETLSSGANFREVLKNVCNDIYKLVKPSGKYRNVISHGDLWATNFLIKYDGGNNPIECRFVDFQWGRYVPPAADLLSLLHLTTSRRFRDRHIDELIISYYKKLSEYLDEAGFDPNKILPLEEFLESCKDYKVFGLLQTAIYFPLILIRTDCVEKYFSDRELSEKALHEDRSLLVTENIKFDTHYEDRLRDALQDLKDYCDKL